jgi:hypothetical protein
MNLLIDRTGDRTTSHTRPDMTNIRSFRGKNRVLNIVEEIGCRYWDFGIMLLDDKNGNFISSIVHQLRDDCASVNSKILTEWINGRRGAKACTWRSLIETLRDIGMARLAGEIEDTLLNE